MSIGAERRTTKTAQQLLRLENGDQMTQAEFHLRYQASPDDEKFELVGGTVYMASPMRVLHSDFVIVLAAAFQSFRCATPGIKPLVGATTILGEDSEPQPDLGLALSPEYGGQSRTNKAGYLEGPPELLGEVAYSTRAIDL